MSDIPSTFTRAKDFSFAELLKHREEQNRPISKNPFKNEDELTQNDQGHNPLKTIDESIQVPKISYRDTGIESPKTSRKDTNDIDDKGVESAADLLQEKTRQRQTKNGRRDEKKNPARDWLDLLFDLSWSATFSNLTSNAKFKEPWVFYTVEFATNDWFHLLAVFLQLILFGALAAAARVIFYAYRTSKSKSIPQQTPRQLWLVPGSLAVSATLFFLAFWLNLKGFGRTSYGAKITFVLWSVALLVEVAAQMIRYNSEIKGLKLIEPIAPIASRLQAITLIILGEGVNSISETFYSIEQAPGFHNATASGMVFCAVIVFLLAYLYSNGPAPPGSVGPLRPKASWVMMHLPWLLSIILLLEGVKNQLLLTSFLNSEKHMIADLNKVVAYNGSLGQDFNRTLQQSFLQAGMIWNDELANYKAMVAANGSSGPKMGTDIKFVWYLKLVMKGTETIYTNFMANDSIPDQTRLDMNKYRDDYNYVLEDARTLNGPNHGNPHLYDILNQLLESSINNGRYVMAVCGVTFITLASLNLIHSWPQDRFQWASILSRYAMGCAMMVLLLLNIGKSQVYSDATVPDSYRAAVLKWMDASWAIPTITLAYIIQFIVDTVLIYLAARFAKRQVPPNDSEVQQS
ncbi:hypothetical protein FRC07_002508 [Ceratobasidium sp. 392]|nr:hypothetical protein FRC07_002508 [Ceratobasidium sp. 392]